MPNFLMSGNEAIARGAYEAGVRVASAYPGTPSTEILENLVAYPGVDASWAPNEKVALEVGIGASFGGARALVAMKHVGVNVAADPLFTLSYIGVRGGLVLACADDPEMHSSQNEQDSRNYAKFAKVPMFEPADSEEARAFTRLAFEVSEQFDTPVMLRSNTRISHGKSVVSPQEPVADLPAPGLRRDPAKMVMLPANARKRHPLVEERIDTLEVWSCEQSFNRVEEGSSDIGIITSGIAYQYVRQLLPDAHILKLGMVYPLPKQLIRDFAARCQTLYVIEELDPFIEEQVKAMGIEVRGKELIPRCGELTPERLESALHGSRPATAYQHTEELPGRPPNMCAGCSHRGVFYTLKRLGAFVTGDIGCYTLGFLPPLSAMDTCVCMGAGISNAAGLIKALPQQERSKVVGVMGDSTFLHTGINSLIDMIYNGGLGTVVLLDNRVTAMTGRQENPGSGYTLAGVESPPIDLQALCRVLGVKHVEVVDPYDLAQTEQVLRQEMAREELSVVIAKRPCMLDRRHGPAPTPALKVVEDHCRSCKACLKLGCPAISWQQDSPSPKAHINGSLCSGCGLCRHLCQFEAIEVNDER
ncbi:indolepyruvate ferredoxin oxidoreductase subunit alpha [Desulfuromonas sp. AOP6]|uniref:indolepyruvate ferredoxin oxidoreductase subunit alpha n=1 Tax=Desulfuromonas sp. AOP6 TaxID=1566351 RepID=UPI001282FC8C|nr:indolepyruvate ferredoxin oxidoreductase subunit alpha [Desulfuromonas sp. AOP6]BCA78809.1 indolepyruvate oxidoreductase subunit IorA [Desulfuromonas sp. AOP6]